MKITAHCIDKSKFHLILTRDIYLLNTEAMKILHVFPMNIRFDIK